MGKILRINADGTIPTDNPFQSTATAVNRSIWAMGLRNLYTFAFQPVSGRMFSNDVGETTSEEINEGVAGASYAWPLTEGPTSDAGFVTIPRPLLVIGSHQDPYGGRRPYNFVWTSCGQRRR